MMCMPVMVQREDDSTPIVIAVAVAFDKIMGEKYASICMYVRILSMYVY